MYGCFFFAAACLFFVLKLNRFLAAFSDLVGAESGVKDVHTEQDSNVWSLPAHAVRPARGEARGPKDGDKARGRVRAQVKG